MGASQLSFYHIRKMFAELIPTLPKSIFQLLRPAACVAALVIALTGCAGGLPPYGGHLPSLARLITHYAPAVVGIGRMHSGSGVENAEVVGSGFRIEGTNIFATASHVVSALGGQPPVVFWQAQRWKVRIYAVDREADLALLQSEEALPMIGLRTVVSGFVQPGDWIVVLGRPFGWQTTATVGILSALPGAVRHPSRLSTMLQLNAAINAGNSGGPVIDMDGNLVGIANATVPGGQGIGFAVPALALNRLLNHQP